MMQKVAAVQRGEFPGGKEGNAAFTMLVRQQKLHSDWS